MIIVCYKSSGLKWVAKEDVDRKEFWEFYQSQKADVGRRVIEEALGEGELEIFCDFPRMSFEIIDERLADGCTRYVARPNDWPINNGEPT